MKAIVFSISSMSPLRYHTVVSHFRSKDGMESEDMFPDTTYVEAKKLWILIIRTGANYALRSWISKLNMVLAV